MGAAGVCLLPVGHSGPHEQRQEPTAAERPPPPAQPPPRNAPAARQDVRVLEVARRVNPAAVDEYEAARADMLQLADMFGLAMIGTEEQAMHWARGVAANVCAISRRWAQARLAVIKCSDR